MNRPQREVNAALALAALGLFNIEPNVARREAERNRPVALCSFCKDPIWTEAERMPNPDCCKKNERRTKWRDARNKTV